MFKIKLINETRLITDIENYIFIHKNPVSDNYFNNN